MLILLNAVIHSIGLAEDSNCLASFIFWSVIEFCTWGQCCIAFGVVISISILFFSALTGTDQVRCDVQRMS